MSSPTHHMDIQTVAGLARLELTAEEAATFSAQLDRVLEHIAKLDQVPLEGVEPTAHASPIFNVTRQDVAQAGLDRQEALALAPRQAAHLFLVPKVIE